MQHNLLEVMKPSKDTSFAQDSDIKTLNMINLFFADEFIQKKNFMQFEM